MLGLILLPLTATWLVFMTLLSFPYSQYVASFQWKFQTHMAIFSMHFYEALLPHD